MILIFQKTAIKKRTVNQKKIIMKNSVLCIGIALVSLTNVCNAANGVGIKGNSVAQKTSSTSKRTLASNHYIDSLTEYEVIESGCTNKIDKTIDELIAEDNAITENNFSNDTQVLDFEIINESDVFEVIESVKTNTIEKSADQFIAEDNAITENNISNDVQALDFTIINRNLISEEIIETPPSPKIEKTADQLIAEDNLITENNISNEIIALDFEIINKKLILVTTTN